MTLRISWVFFIFLGSCNVLSSAEESGTGGESSLGILLPKNLKPLHYLVRLQPFINGNFSIHGYVEISFKVMGAINKIVLNIKDIITRNETVKVHMEKSDENFEIIKQEYYDKKQFYVATLGSTLERGKVYVISMDYQGYLNEQLKGFYRSSYKDESDNTRNLAVTQFQATDARRAFPCFDEPGFKANFSIEMIREEGMMAVSNMPLESSLPWANQPGWVKDRFLTSVPMSTYLVAFIVSDFKLLFSNETSYKFAVMTRSNAIDQVGYALEIGPKIMKFFEEFFNVPYPLPKLYMAAVPDFSFGGMENWGLIIYRESGLLWDSSFADAYAKRRTSLLVSHELAHMWFGDLVTPYWWSDLWLNEGFASYVEYLGMNAVDPAQKFLDQMVILDLQRAFSRDSIESSHPISIPVEHPNEINEIFDAISYQKGASVIRMMSHFLTEDTFREALKYYLKDLSYKNAKQDDLWRYMTQQGHMDGTLSRNFFINEIMDTWTLQMGFPVVSVRKNTDRTISLKQERFLMSKSPNSTDTHDYKWWIPITMTSSSNPDFTQTKPTEWMKASEAEKTLKGIPFEDDWMVFNIKSVGYYRVNYETDNWKALSQQLMENNEAIHPVNRAQILDDSLNLARADILPYEIALNILSYVKNEREYVPLVAALNGMDYLQKMLRSSDEYPILKRFFLSLLVPHYEEVGFEDHPSDRQLDQQRRIEVLQWACKLAHEVCIKGSIELFSQWMQNPKNNQVIPPNLKKIVYCTAIAAGGSAEWDFAWKRYTEVNVGTERDLLLKTLACSKDSDTLKRYIERAIDPSGGIRKQDAKYVLSSIANNDIGKAIAWQFLRERWTDITSYFGTAIFTLTGLIESTTKYLNTPEELEQLREFRNANRGKFLSATRAVEQAEENTRINIEWMEKSYVPIVQWLKSQRIGEEDDHEVRQYSHAQPIASIINAHRSIIGLCYLFLTAMLL